MKKFIKLLSTAFTIILMITCITKVNAETIKLNDKIYFLDTKDIGNVKMYIFNQSNGNAAWSWGDSKGSMTDSGKKINGHTLYEYTLTDSYFNDYHDSIIFTYDWNSGEKQTINLSYIRKNIMFVPSSTVITDNKLDGEWYILDKSELNELVSNANNKNQDKYTTSSYANLKYILDTKEYKYDDTEEARRRGYKINFAGVKDVLNTDFVLVGHINNYSIYDDAVTDLNDAINNLVEKNKIITSNNSNGIISLGSKYFEDNETINFTLTPSNGYQTKSITIKKITGYNTDGSPILSTNSNDITEINPNDSNSYSYDSNTEDIYIDVTFKKKTYTITTTMADAGTISPLTPITVEHGSGQEFIITPNEGYKIKSILINGIEYNFTDNKIKLENITEDTEITIIFELKEYIVTIDGIDYTLTYNSTIDELGGYENIIKKAGYKFIGFKIAGTNEEFDIKTKVTQNIKLETTFEQISTEENNNSISSDKENPKTGDKIIYSFLGIILATTGIILLIVFRKKLTKKA